MTSSSKQRIIGAFVLCALALIFFPVLFDLSGEQTIDTRTAIPPMPEIEPIKIPEPKKISDVVAPKSPNKAFQPSIDVEEKVTREPTPPKLSKQGLPEAWVLQVGSFSDRTKAKELSARLKTDGYKSYVQEILMVQGPMHRVLVGPKILKKDALVEQQKIEKRYKLKAILREFKP